MSNFWPKQRASRLNKYQSIAWPGTGTVVSTGFQSQTNQIRVVTQLTGWGWVDNVGTVPTTAGGSGAIINSGLAGEYFAVSPGEIFSFSSTTTSSGALVNIIETA